MPIFIILGYCVGGALHVVVVEKLGKVLELEGLYTGYLLVGLLFYNCVSLRYIDWTKIRKRVLKNEKSGLKNRR